MIAVKNTHAFAGKMAIYLAFHTSISVHLHRIVYQFQISVMMTSSIWNIFRVTGHLWGEFTNLRLSERLSKLSWGLWFETPSRTLWRHCNEITRVHLTDAKHHSQINLDGNEIFMNNLIKYHAECRDIRSFAWFCVFSARCHSATKVLMLIPF